MTAPLYGPSAADLGLDDLIRPGAVIQMAVVPIVDLRAGRRMLVGRLVDSAGALAEPGAKPKVRAFPGLDCPRVLTALAEYGTSSACSPGLAQYLTRHYEVLGQWVVVAQKRGDQPVLLVGTYQCVDRPAETVDEDLRPIEFRRSDGSLVSTLHHGGAM